jgi:hypothetical protein
LPKHAYAEEPQFDMKAGAVVTWADAGAPLGRFLLVRRADDSCAIRFTEYHEGHDAKLTSGEQTLYARYEWYYQKSPRPDFKVNAISGKDDLVKKPLLGIGRLAFQTGKTVLKCGPLKLG